MSKDTKRIYEQIREPLSEDARQGKATPERIRAVVAEAISTAMREGKIGSTEAATHGREALRAVTDAAREVGSDAGAGACNSGQVSVISEHGNSCKRRRELCLMH